MQSLCQSFFKKYIFIFKVVIDSCAKEISMSYLMIPFSWNVRVDFFRKNGIMELLRW